MGLTDEPVVMFVGGFYLWHDLILLLESFSRVVHEIPNAKLILIGDGKTRSTIEQKTVDSRLEQAVIMTGTVDHNRIPEMLAIADVVVAPFVSFFSGQGGSALKLFEYMAAGKAIVATRTGQVAEIIRNDHNGLLVEAGDVNGFANAIVTLLEQPMQRNRLGRNARREAVEHHSWEQYAKRLEEIYMRVH